MEIVLTEKIKLSDKEYKAFTLVEQCCHSVMRESKDTENCNIANVLFNAICDFYGMMEDIEGEPTEEHSWDERHIPTQYELNP